MPYYRLDFEVRVPSDPESIRLVSRVVTLSMSLELAFLRQIETVSAGSLHGVKLTNEEPMRLFVLVAFAPFVMCVL